MDGDNQDPALGPERAHGSIDRSPAEDREGGREIGEAFRGRTVAPDLTEEAGRRATRWNANRMFCTDHQARIRQTDWNITTSWPDKIDGTMQISWTVSF